ncbi:MAG: helix-turn-helix domain-containing protein [Pseudomonadales bacterium]|nr:helix-turn-helix domain-containing protein [Pseudomonadales bacterium]
MSATISAQAEHNLLNPDDYEAARQSRDARFDGRFFVGVLTTGIYCRPVCPVRIPRKENVQLYRSAAAAAAAGFRPCLRCRPESSPGTPAWSGSSWKVSRALQLIDRGFLDNDSVEVLAGQLGIGPRQLARLFQSHLGASPVEVAQTRRLHFAKKLIDETSMPLAEVSFAAGFGSVRRFNAVFINTYGRSPRQLRDKQGRQARRQASLQLTLSYRPPFDWRAMLAFLAYRAIPGVEVVTDSSYARTFSIDGEQGHFEVRFGEQSHALQVQIVAPQSHQLTHIVDRIRSIFDLRADSAFIDENFSKDKLLGAVVKANPGLRVPGCWSGFEVAVRAILGQQVSVKAASTLVARVAARHGSSYHADDKPEGLDYVFPEAEQLVNADLNKLGIVGSRIAAIQALAGEVASGDLLMDCSVDSADFVARICEIKGIGEWTAQYIAMRALDDPNAFPHSDLILRRAAAAPGQTLTPKQLLVRAEAWQPWRAYAVILLWRHYASLNN